MLRRDSARENWVDAILMNRARIILSALFIPVAFCSGLWLRFARPWESAIERAYPVGNECVALEPEDVDRIATRVREWPDTREKKLRAFREMFADPLTADRCQACAEAMRNVSEQGLAGGQQPAS